LLCTFLGSYFTLGLEGTKVTDWYVYHSAETMDCRYGNPDRNHVFSTSIKKKLCLNDNIWIIEGFGETPKTFYLAAHFAYKETEYPPFPSPYAGEKYTAFKAMYAGVGDSYGKVAPIVQTNICSI
jgi:hypothetical protein